MNEHENHIADMLRNGMRDGWQFSFLTSRNAIRAYSTHGVTIMTVELDDASEAAQDEYLDIVMPAL